MENAHSAWEAIRTAVLLSREAAADELAAPPELGTRFWPRRIGQLRLL
jgi:hypothetical protein